MTLLPIPLAGADLRFDPQWLQPALADVLFAALRDEVAWDVHRIRLFGREVDSPRLSCWIGDDGASYRYSGVRFAPPWPAMLLPVRERLRQELDASFNSVLANRYRHGRDAMGWHSDDERELGPTPLIASLSLGATRRFVLKDKRDSASKLVIDLPHGSLLLMAGDTQRHYGHALPRTTRVVGERINLTFRQITTPL